MNRTALLRLGELLYGGDRWGAQLAADLTELGSTLPAPKKASQSQVSTWTTGAAEIPAWVVPLARALAVKGQVDLARRSAALAELVADPKGLVASEGRQVGIGGRIRRKPLQEEADDQGPPEEIIP